MDHISCFTTVANADFVTFDDEVNIPRCGKRACIDVTIIDDTLFEPDEVFRISLERTLILEGNIILQQDRTTAEIHIHNTDGRCIV